MNDKERMIKLQRLIQELGTYATRLYSLMDEGMTVEITFPEVQAIVIPNQPPKIQRLIITKPVMHVNIKLQPEAERPGGKHGSS